MDWIQNLWQHPKTSVAGLLIATATVAGVLSQQGITLGTAGTGTVVELIAALATALLGLLAKDPGAGERVSKANAAKLGTGLVVAALIPALTLSGCTISSNQLKNDAAALASALTSLSAAMNTTDAATAAKLELAAASLTSVVNNWDSSSSIAVLNTAAAGAETLLAGISSTSKYTALVAIAVAALDVILANTSVAKTPAMKLSNAESDHLLIARLSAQKLVTHRVGRSAEGDFKSAWNRAIDAEKLPLAKLR